MIDWTIKANGQVNQLTGLFKCFELELMVTKPTNAENTDSFSSANEIL